MEQSHGSGGKRQGKDGRKGPNNAQVRAKAEQIATTAGIPRNLAFLVASGRMELGTVVQSLARRNAADRLMSENDIPRSLAMQIALGQADLNQVMRKRRLEAYLEENRSRSVLDEYRQSGRPVALAIHGQALVRGTITTVTPYEIELQAGEVTHTLHKLQLKLAYDPDDYKVVKKAFSKVKGASPAEPVRRPQDRYTCSDKRLFGYLDAGTEVVATSLEGEMVRGRVTWMSRWEFAMEVGRGGSVVIFRHALSDIRSA